MTGSKPRILVVDDEPAIALTLQTILENEGYEAESAGGGAEAIAAVRQRHYDVVLTDLRMPRVDGMAVLEEVRLGSPQTATLVLTGYASLDSALEAVHRGAFEYLMKPVEVAQLKLAVERALERKRLSEIESLYRVQNNLASAQNEQSVAREITDAACKVLNVDHGYLFLMPAEESLRAAALPPAGNDVQLLTELRNGQVIRSGENTAAGEWARQRNIADFALVPGAAQGELVCVLYVHNGERPYDFHASSLRFLRALAGQAALVLRNRELISRLRLNNQELAAANRKLQELDRLKSQFLSVATHELRTPLSVLLGYNRMLAESLRERLNGEEAGILEESASACKRLIRLVNSMLDISQIESGRMQMTLAPADLRQGISAVERLFRHEAESRGIGLHVNVPARLPRLLLDSERIQQVLINLVGNAIKFTPAGGQITISLHMAGRGEAESLEIVVRDTGIGIAADAQRVIFSEFAVPPEARSLPAPQANTERGFGLGLAIARRIIEAHGGSIRLSSSPGEGSTFTVSLPVRRLAAAAKHASLTA
ncbi:MAG: response regulator [Acidobacteria bacterium]|nr:response regulator [Acidobacteriota bacterium]